MSKVHERTFAGRASRSRSGADHQCQAFARADLVRGKVLAHKAREGAVVAVERAVGVDSAIRSTRVVPATFTHPQGASVGLGEANARESGGEV